MSNLTMSNYTIAPPPDMCKQPTSPWFIGYTVFLILILLGTLFGNGLVVLAVFMFSRLRRVSNFFIVSLAVSDLFLALMTLPLRIDQSYHNHSWCLPNSVCVFWISSDNIWSAASIGNLAIISIDRFLAITKPFVYQEKMTNKVCFILISFVWLYAITWSLLSLVNWSTGDTSLQWVQVHPVTGWSRCGTHNPIFYSTLFVCAFVLPLCVIIVTYVSIFRVALRQSKSMASHDPNKRGNKRSVRELKATKTIAIVIGAFVVCWFPFFIIVLTFAWCPTKCFAGILQYPALFQAIQIPFMYILPILNSTINPIVYGIHNKEFKDAFRKLVFWKKRNHHGADYLMDEYSAYTEVSAVQRDANSNRRAANGSKLP